MPALYLRAKGDLRLVDAARRGEVTTLLPRQRAAAIDMAGLPLPPNFVGRKAELAELCALVRQPECRLLTLQGPGGAGKSRLARQACVHLQSHLGDGVLWVELEDLADVAEVPARLAQNLGLMGLTGDDAGKALEQLCAALPPGPALWVLDNAEHLAQLGPLLARLLAAAPGQTRNWRPRKLHFPRPASARACGHRPSLRCCRFSRCAPAFRSSSTRRRRPGRRGWRG